MKILMLVLFFIFEVNFGLTYLLPYLMTSNIEVFRLHPEGFYWGFLAVALVVCVGLFVLPSSGKN